MGLNLLILPIVIYGYIYYNLIIKGTEVIKMKKYNIYCDGHYWYGTDDIVKAVRECKNMMVCGIEREAITVWNDEGHMITLLF